MCEIFLKFIQNVNLYIWWMIVDLIFIYLQILRVTKLGKEFYFCIYFRNMYQNFFFLQIKVNTHIYNVFYLVTLITREDFTKNPNLSTRK